MLELVKMIGEDLYKIKNNIEDNIYTFEYRQNAINDIDNILEVLMIINIKLEPVHEWYVLLKLINTLKTDIAEYKLINDYIKNDFNNIFDQITKMIN